MQDSNLKKIKLKETSSFSQLERYYTTCQQESNEIEINRLISNVSKRMNSIKSNQWKNRLEQAIWTN